MTISSLQVVTGYYDSLGTPAIDTVVTAQLGAGWIPYGAPVLTDVYGKVAQIMVKSPSLTTTAYTVVTGANPMAVDATWNALGDPLWIDSTRYLQAYTKGAQVISPVNLTTQVTDTLPVANGGTGATTASGARTNLGLGTVATLNTVSLTSDVTGTLPVANGGTGATTVSGVRNNFAIDRFVQATPSQTQVYSGDLTKYFAVDNTSPWGMWDVTGGNYIPLGVAQGGTGATTASGARTNLGLGTVATLNTVSLTSDVTGTLPVANGGTGATSSSGVRNNFAIDRFVQSTASQTQVRSGDFTKYFVVDNTVPWGVWGVTEGNYIPLGVAQGGTGARNATDARANLGAAAASDRRIKHDIEDYDGLMSLSNLAAIRPRTFVFNDDSSNRVRRGVIAQEIADIDKDYVQNAHRTLTDDNGNVIKEEDILILDNNVLLMDAVIAIKVLNEKISDLEQQLANR